MSDVQWEQLRARLIAPLVRDVLKTRTGLPDGDMLEALVARVMQTPGGDLRSRIDVVAPLPAKTEIGSTAFRFDDVTMTKLRDLAKRTGTTQVAVLRSLIDAAHQELVEQSSRPWAPRVDEQRLRAEFEAEYCAKFGAFASTEAREAAFKSWLVERQRQRA